MIALLTGKIVEKDFSSCLIDVRGVGYEVLIPLSTFDRLPLIPSRQSEQAELPRRELLQPLRR